MGTPHRSDSRDLPRTVVVNETPLNDQVVRVGMNLLWLRPGKVGGSETYIVRILEEIVHGSDDCLDVVVYALASFETAYPDLKQHLTVRTPPAAASHSRVTRVVAENTWLPWRIWRDDVDVMTHAGGTMPLFAGPNPILTLHDIQYLDLRENFSAVKRWWLGRVVPRSVSRATAVVVATPHTSDRVIDAVGALASQVVIVPHAVPRSPVGTPRGRSGFTRPYMYLPAWTHPHKNHEVVLRAMTKTDGIDLVMTGGRGSADASVRSTIQRLGLGDRVHNLGHVSSERVEALYADAAALVFPSRYEGFGVPVVEAMVRGVPVIASTASAVAEVVDTAGVLVDPDDVDGWAAAIDSLSDPEERNELIRLGTRRAEAFVPSKAVELLTALWVRCVRRT